MIMKEGEEQEQEDIRKYNRRKLHRIILRFPSRDSHCLRDAVSRRRFGSRHRLALSLSLSLSSAYERLRLRGRRAAVSCCPPTIAGEKARLSLLLSVFRSMSCSVLSNLLCLN